MEATNTMFFNLVLFSLFPLRDPVVYKRGEYQEHITKVFLSKNPHLALVQGR